MAGGAPTSINVWALLRDGIWLFGSQVAGSATKASDVDLDLVDLGTCDRALAREITTTGRVVYDRGQ
jgi:hypothetical protein